MKAAPILPPAPLGASCPLWMLVEWSEVFRNGLVSRSKVLLEVDGDDGPAAAGERWLALVSWDLKSAHLRTALAPPLSKQYNISNPSAGLDRATVSELFQKMRSADEAVWFVDLFRWGGAAIFIRKPADDSDLARIITFNRQGRAPIKWRFPRPRVYPPELRQAYAEQLAALQKGEIAPAKNSPQATSRPRGSSPPRRRGQGGTPQA